MRSPPALLLIAVLFGALPARAVDCRTGAFDDQALSAFCGPSAKPDDCSGYRKSFTKACLDRKDAAEDALYKLKALPSPTPDQQKEIQANERVVEEVKAAFADAIKASEDAQKLPPGDTPAQRFGEMERIPATQNLPFLGSFLINTVYEPPDPEEKDEGKKDEGKTDAGTGAGTDASTAKKNETVSSTVDNMEREAMKGPTPDAQQLALAGRISSNGGQGARTERIARELIAAAPKDPRGPDLAARAALMNGRPDLAASWSRKALALEPADGDARRMLGYASSLLSKSRLKGPAAKPDFGATDEDAGAGGPGPRSGSGAKPGAQSANAPPAGAAPAWTGPAGTSAPLAPRHLSGAQAKAAVGDYAGAYGDLSRALALFPDDDAARAMRAEISLAMGNPEAALADADQILAKHPSDARAMRARASALLQLGRLDEALATVDRAILLEVMAASGHLIRAQILEKLGRVLDAAAEYREASRLDPALTPVTQEALRRLGLAPAAAPAASPRLRLVRGGLIALALALLLAGFLGGAAKLRTQRSLTTTTSPK